MVDIPQQQWQDLLNQITRLVGGINRVGNALGGTNGNSGDRGRAANQLEREMTGLQKAMAKTRGAYRSAKKVDYEFTNTVMELTESAQSLSNTFSNIIKGFAGGHLVGRMIQTVTNNTQTYQRLNEVGQTFGGSMLDMAKQAGSAGLSLDDFAKLMEKSSSAAAALTRLGPGGNLPALALQVRRLTEQQGMYGMSLDALNEFTADYAENLRLQGMLESGTNETRANAINQFAQDVSTFSAMTGKARREIAEAARTALRDVSVTSRLRATQDASQRRSLEQATSFLAAIPGEAGTALSAMIGQTFGYGTALFADGARTFYDAGMGHIVSQFDRLGARIAGGEDVTDEMFTFAEEFAQQVDAQREGLRLQALAGNESAKQILRMRDNMDVMLNLTEAQRRQMRLDATTRARSTAFFSSFNSIFSRLMGSIREGFFGELEGVGEGLGRFLDSANFENMAESFKAFGKNLGVFIGKILTPDNIMRFGEVVKELVTSAADFITTILTPENIRILGEGIGAMVSWSLWAISGLGSLASAITSATEAVHGFYQRIASFFGASDSNAGFAASIATVVTAVVGYMVARNTLGVVMNAALSRLGVVTVSGRVVNVNGVGVGGSGVGGSGGGRGRGVGAAIGRGAPAAAAIGLGALAHDAIAPDDYFGRSFVDGAMSGGMLGSFLGPKGALAGAVIGGVGNVIRENAGAVYSAIQNNSLLGDGRNNPAPRILDESSLAPEPERAAVPLATLQRNLTRLTRQIESERAANSYGGVAGADTPQLIELLREQNELLRQVERRRSADADRQIRATEAATP